MSHDGSCFLRRPTLALLLTIVLISFLFQITRSSPKALIRTLLALDVIRRRNPFLPWSQH